MRIGTAADALLAALLAPECAACRRPLDRPTRSAVCESCWNRVQPLRPPLCRVCSDPLPAWTARRAAGYCAPCQLAPGPVAAGRAVGEYEGALRDILHAFKYEGRQSLAPSLAALMRVHGAGVLEGADAVVPVPLHWRRRIRRGFNQSADLAVRLGLPVLYALRRSRYTRPQADLPADARHQNVHGAFAVRSRRSLQGMVLVLVDDVSTTGATLQACGAALLAAGAREVRTLTAARVVTRPPPARPR